MLGLPLAALSLQIDFKNKFFDKKCEIESELNRALFLTGHSDGKLCVWRYGELLTVLAEYKAEVTCLGGVPRNGGVAVGTSRGQVFLVRK